MNEENGALYVGMQTDNKQFLGAISEAERRIKGFSDATTLEGQKVNRTFTEISKNLTAGSESSQKAFKREIGLIADLEEALRELKEAKRSAFTVEEIEKYNQKIQEAELNLKEYNEAGKQTIDNNEKQEESTTSLTGSISKFILGATGAAAILGQLKKAWLETSFGINAVNIGLAAYKQLMYDIVTGGDINIAKIKTAIDLQRELNDLRIKEYKESYESAKLNNEYQNLYAQSLDQTLERTERIRLIDEALAAHNKKVDIEVNNIKENLSVVTRQLQNAPDSEKLKKEYADLMVSLENAEAERVKSTKRLLSTKSGLIKEGIEEEKKWREDLHNKLMKWVEEENKISEDQANKLKELSASISELKLDGKDRELKKLDNQYEQEMELYKDNAEIQMKLTEEYALKRLEIEKKYLKELQKENEKFAESLEKIDPGKGYSILNRSLERKGIVPATGGEFSKEGKDNFKLAESSKRWLKEIQKDIKENNKDQEESLKKQIELRRELLSVTRDITIQLAEQLGVQDEIIDAYASSMDMLSALASGDYLAAAASLVQTVINASKIAEITAEDLAETMSWFNEEVEKLDKRIEKAGSEGGKSQSIEDKLKVLKSLQYGFEYDVSFAEFKLRHSTFLNANSRAEALDAAKKNLETFNEELESTQKLYDELIRGGLTENDIADAIAAGFRDGKTSVDDFAEYMNDVLLDSVLNVFKNELLGPAMNELTKDITEYLSDKKLTSEEKADIDQKVSAIAEANKQLWDDLTGSLNLGGSDSNKSLTGAIKGVSEETASVIAGQMNAMRISQAETNDIVRQQLMSLHEIAANTRYLISIDGKLDSLRSESLRPQGLN